MHYYSAFNCELKIGRFIQEYSKEIEAYMGGTVSVSDTIIHLKFDGVCSGVQ